MKILHLASEYPPQPVFGLGRYVQELAEAQAAAGDSVTVLTNSHGGQEPRITRNGVAVRRVRHPPPPKAPTSSSMLLHFNLQLVELCVDLVHDSKGLGWDVINAHDWLTFPAAFHLARLLRLPVATTIHDVIFNKVRRREFTFEDEYVAGIENWACQVSSRIIVLSESVKREVMKYYHTDERKVVVVPGGVAMKPMGESDLAQVAQWRARFATEEEDLLLYAGRLDFEKGLETLLAAARLLQDRGQTQWKLVLAGSGQLEPAVREDVKRFDLGKSVVFAGYLPFDEIRLAYTCADMLIVPSKYEPFGLVALEAQKMGTPVIASETGGLAEIINSTGGGLLFEPGNATSLADSIERLLNDPALRVKYGAIRQEKTTERYNWNRIATEIRGSYESILKDGPPDYISIPSWSAPKSDAIVRGQVARTTEDVSSKTVHAGKAGLQDNPVNALTIFWNSAKMQDLKVYLNCLSGSHALNALNGIIYVVPVVVEGDAEWKPPLEHPRIQYISQTGSIAEQLRQSAALIADSGIAAVLIKSGLIVPRLIPTIWVGKNKDLPAESLALTKVDEIHAAATKLLCDNEFRKRIAPELFNEIPSVDWSSDDRKRPLVLHVVPQIVTGGAETTLLEIVKGTATSFDHRILCIGPTEGPLPGELRASGAGIIAITNSGKFAVLNVLESSKPDIIHLHSMSYVPSWIQVHRLLSGRRIIETEHVVNIGSGHFGPVNSVICVSDATKRAHDPYLPVWGPSASKFEVIYNGINLQDFSNLPSRNEARKMLGLPLDRPIIGRVSALARGKLPMEALEALPIVLRACPDALFVIVGDGPERSAAEQWIKSHQLSERVLFLGERRDIPSVLRAFDVFGYYTNKDALGNVILEAIAAGVPVVATDIEGTREALGDAPGELVRLNDCAKFAKAIKRWLAPKRRKPGSYKLPEKFSRSAMSESYKHVYGRLLSASISKAENDSIKEHEYEVSILMPVFNTRKEWLIESLDSIKNQVYQFWNLVIVDDGSDGEYHDWLSSAISNDSLLKKRTQIVRLSSNKGVAEALNAGLQACRTELVARMDADDRMRPDRLSLQVAAFIQLPGLSVLGGWAELLEESGQTSNGRYWYPCGHRQILAMLGNSCAFAHPTVMFRRSAVLNVGGYRPECRHFEDYDLWVRMGAAGHRFANLPTVVLDYRLHDNSVSHLHREQQGLGALDCAERARTVSGCFRRPKVIFTGLQHSYGIPGRGLSIEQFFFARALQYMSEIDLTLLPVDELIRKHGQRRAGELLNSHAREIGADMVFTVLGNPELDFLPEHIQALTDAGILTLNWNCDDHWRHEHTAKWAAHYTNMITTDAVAMEYFRGKGIAEKIIQSQWACNPYDYSPGTGTKDIDVSFIGQPYGNRSAMVQALRDAGLHVTVHGAGWEGGQEIGFGQMIEVLRRSKVVLNFSRATQGNRRQIKARFFEIPACGSFMMTEHADGMEQYLQIGRHYDTFESPEELVEKTGHWLSESKRDLWALEASNIVRSVHTYPWRLQGAFEAIGLYDRK